MGTPATATGGADPGGSRPILRIVPAALLGNALPERPLALAVKMRGVRPRLLRAKAYIDLGQYAEAFNDADEIGKIVPILDVTDRPRYPVMGGTFQPRAGISKHDYVAWGYARGAHARGVHIIQGRELARFETEGNTIPPVRTPREPIAGCTRPQAASGR